MKTIAEAGEKVFGILDTFVDVGSRIHDLAQQADLTAETMSVLKVAAETGGSSLEDVGKKATKFTASLVDAAGGNKELRAELTKFGIDATTAYKNPDQALAAFITRFNELPDSAVKNRAEMALFKDKTGEMIPVLKQVDGSFQDYKTHLQALGLIMSQDAADAADRLGDQFKELKEEAEGVAIEFASGLAPAVSSTVAAMDEALGTSGDTWQRWGKAVGDAIDDVRVALETAARWTEAMEGSEDSLNPATIADSVNAEIDQEQRSAKQIADGNAILAKLHLDKNGNRTTTDLTPTHTGGGGGDKQAKAYEAAVKNAKDAAQAIIETVQSETAKLDREYNLQLISLEDYVTQTKAQIEKKRQAVVDETDAEQEAVLKRTKLSYAERHALIEASINTATKANDEAAKASQGVDDKVAAEKLNRYIADAQQANAVQDEYDRARLARDEFSANERAQASAKASRIMSDAERAALEERKNQEDITYTELAKAQDAIETAAYKAQKKQLTNELDLAEGNLAEKKKIQGQLALLEAQRLTAQQAGSRRLIEAQRKDVEVGKDAIDAARDRAQAMADLDFSVVGSTIDTQRQNYEAILAGSAQYGTARRYALANLTELDLEELQLKHDQNVALLNLDRNRQLEQETDWQAAKKINDKYDKLIKDEDDRLKTAKKNRESKGKVDDANSGPGGSFDAGIQSGQMIQAMQKGEDGLYHFAGSANVAFSAIGAGFNQLGTAAGAFVSQLVLMGNQGDQSLAKVTASLLANVAAQAATQAVLFTAYGIAALTPWGAAIYGSAAQWFQAAALMASIAAGTGLAGRAAAGNKFNTAATGSTSTGANDGQPDPNSPYASEGYAGNRFIRNRNVPLLNPEQARTNAINERLARALETLEMAKPGDLLQRGIAQRPRLIGTTMLDDLKKSPTLVKQMGTVQNL